MGATSDQMPRLQVETPFARPFSQYCVQTAVPSG
jgi:hypothetical protein